MSPKTSNSKQQNYFNYFTEIEEEFVRRRGSHMLVSPMDWALIETWRQRGVPLRIALRGISQSFDVWDQKPRRGRKVNSLFYCQQAVEEAFEQYCEAHIGANGHSDNHHDDTATNGNGHATEPRDASPFSIENIRYALHEHCETFSRLCIEYEDSPLLAEEFDRAARRLREIVAELGTASNLSLEQIDKDLSFIEERLLDGLAEHLGGEELDKLHEEGNRQLKEYRNKMESQVYEQTLGNWIARRLRERYRVPRLSLFYLC